MECENCKIQVRGFEKLDNEFAIIPKRSTKKSAGYDFFSPMNFPRTVLHPHTTFILKTDITAYMPEDEYLDLRMRSGLSIKGLIFLNGAGVIDSDYYGKNIGAILYNLSDEDIVITPGMKICQGIFTKYNLVDDDDSVIKSDRVGGFGSTGEY